MSYESEQERLRSLLDEFLSEEEQEGPLEYSSEEYEPDSDGNISSSSSEHKRSTKRIKIVESQPSTSSAIDNIIDTVVKQFRLSSSEDENEDPSDPNDAPIIWKPVTGQYLKHFPQENKDSGVPGHIFDQMIGKDPVDFFRLFVNDEIIKLMVTETNTYAAQKADDKKLKPHSRLKKWKETNAQEMLKFLGLQIWMGLVHLPSLASYWSNNVLYSNNMKSVMSRNRFELLMSNWHFSDNSKTDCSDRLRKLTPLLQLLLKNFKEHFIPGENLCIDETLVPFRGRLSFRQYIKNKRHKFGVKVYKLCVEDGYTYDMKIYCGAEKEANQTVPTSVVMKLVEPLLDCSRTIYTDNYYTSVELAKILLSRRTHLVATLRKNRKNNPKTVIQTKVGRGGVLGSESEAGIVVLKWQDKREVLMLSTKHIDNLVAINTRAGEVTKPQAVIDYNKCKAFIDLSDQIKAYATCLRRGIKWYRKLGIELLLGSAMVNSFILYKIVNGEGTTITQFREAVAKSLVEDAITARHLQPQPEDVERHFLTDMGNTCRRRCPTCYKSISEMHGRTIATQKTPSSRWRCIQCDKHYCVECFTQSHYCSI